MRKLKTNKGITLIALIITIIVMLILVGVSVSVALNGRLFKTAQEAVDRTKAAVREESGLRYNYEIAKATGEFTGDYSEYILEAHGLKIGDKVNYDETDGTPLAYETDASKGTGADYNLAAGKYTIEGTGTGEIEAGNLEWRVLGVNDQGQVELISTAPTTNELYLKGEEGYLNAVTENGTLGTLDTFCNNLYGKGAGAASARSLTAEDINKLTGFDPKTDYDGYGEKYTYICFNNAVYGIKSSLYETYITDRENSVWQTYGFQHMTTPYWKIGIDMGSDNEGPEELENTEYSYSINIPITDPVDMKELIAYGEGEGKKEYRANKQLLATRGILANETAGHANIASILHYDLSTSSDMLLESYDQGTPYTVEGFVRPVVTLNLDVEFTKVSEGVFDI